MHADLTPNSNDTRVTLSEVRLRMSDPVALSPVNETFETRGSATSRLPTVAPGPGSTDTQAPGTPASTSSSPSISAVSGVYDAGFTITGLPQASAGAIFHAAISSGKFQGTMSAVTPT